MSRLVFVVAATLWACNSSGGGGPGSSGLDANSQIPDGGSGPQDSGPGPQDSGSGIQGSGSDAANYSCDLTTAGAMTCTTYDYSGLDLTASEITALEASCTDDGGTVAGACTTQGAVGRCSYIETAGSMSVEERVWYYSGDATTDSEACSDNGGTWTSGE